MADFSHVSAGENRQPYRSAGWLNAVSDAAAYHQSQVSGGQQKTGSQSFAASGSHVKVKNVSGSGLLRGHCVQLGDYSLTELDHRALWFECDAPADPITSRIAIMRVATPDDKFGEAQMQGITTAIVDVTDVDHTHATPVDGDIVMASGTSGLAEILSPLTETGEQEIVVRLGGGGSARASLQGALAIIKGTVPPSTAIDVSSTILNSSTGALTSGKGFTPGLLESDPDPYSETGTVVTTFTAGALLCNPDGTPIVLDCGEDGYSLDVVDVLNPMQGTTSTDGEFIGQGDGVVVAGHLLEMGEGETFIRVFIPPTHEVRTHTGFDADNANIVVHQPGDDGQLILLGFTAANLQSIGHDASGDAEWQDDGACD